LIGAGSGRASAEVTFDINDEAVEADEDNELDAEVRTTWEEPKEASSVDW
jgi:hypothetical protein